MRALFSIILVLILLAGVIYISIWDSNAEARIERIVIVTFDTLRADHLGCYGYPRETSPFIDQLSAGGMIFRQAYATMPTTVPSHASLFTSYYPIQLDVLKNGHVLNGKFTTLAETLQEADFTTAGFVAIDHLFEQSNLHQGFDYFDAMKLPPDILYRTADQIIDATISWLNDYPADKRLFLWLHFYDAHGPYRPPEEYMDEFEIADGEDRDSFIKFLIEKRNHNPELFSALPSSLIEETIDMNRYSGESGDGTETMLRIINAYDGEVRFLDSELKRLYKYFKRRGLNQNTLWIITSDHGEGLGNHNWLEHSKYLYNEQIHVPLIFHCPGLIPPNRSSENLVSLSDIFPTLIDLTGVMILGEDHKFQGRSLAPNLLSREPEFIVSPSGSRDLFAQRRQYTYNIDPDDVISPEKGYEGESYSLQNKRYKYIFHTAAADEFYDLDNDSGELDNLVSRGGNIERDLKNSLIDRVKYFKSTTGG